jgi:hypothetical protein
MLSIAVLTVKFPFAAFSTATIVAFLLTYSTG